MNKVKAHPVSKTSGTTAAGPVPMPKLRSALATGSLAGVVLACNLAAAPTVDAQPIPPTSPLQEGAGTASISLPTVEVSGTQSARALPELYSGGQVARGASVGLLGTRGVMDTPFNTTSYTSQLIEDQQGRTAADTLVNDSSVRLTTGSNGFDDTFQIRGFPVPAGDVGLNGLFGLVSSNRVDAQIIERIDLLRGPGALINGIAPGGSIGGGINIITKRADDTPLTRLTTTYIGSGNVGTHLDLGRRYGQNREWGVRVNGLYRDGEASIDHGNLRTGLGSIGLDYRGDRLRWTFDGIFQRDDTRNFRPQISLLPTITAIPTPPNARSNWFPGTRLSQQDGTVASRLEYDLTDAVTVYAAAGYRRGENSQIFPIGTRAVDALGNFGLGNSYYDSYSDTVSGTVGANWRFDLLGIRHTLNVGYTGFQQEAGNAYIPSARTVLSNIYNPAPLPVITAPRTDPRRAAVTDLQSVAIADTLSFLDDRLLLTGGVRTQNVTATGYNTTTGARTTRYDADATSPLGGLVIKPWQNVSLYANYAEGLSTGTIVGVGYNNVGAILSPYKSAQYEAGIRVDWGSLLTSVSVFQIGRPTAIRTADNNLAYDGEQRNRGVELSAYGEIVPGLRGLASATFLKPELTNPALASDRGNNAIGVPDRTFSGALDWDVPGAHGVALNTRVIYTSGSFLNTANTLRFDGGTRVDFGVRYSTEIARKPVIFRANLENAFGANYWLTTGTYVTVASPRTLVASGSINF